MSKSTTKTPETSVYSSSSSGDLIEVKVSISSLTSNNLHALALELGLNFDYVLSSVLTAVGDKSASLENRSRVKLLQICFGIV